jgi:hypothetical protein
MKEVEFAFRVRQALNEGAEQLAPRTLHRLEQARKVALARRKTAGTQVAWMPAATRAGAAAVPQDAPSRLWSWLFPVGVAVPVALLLVGFVSVYQWRQSEQIDELAAIDFAVLLDDQPLSTYADRGFGALLNDEQGL